MTRAWLTLDVSDRELARVGALFVSWALLVIAAAYLAICFHTGSPWPWSFVVHEDGKRTLINTLLFYEHATRELPIDLLLGGAVGSTIAFSLPSRTHVTATWPALALLLVITVIIYGAAYTGGMQEVLENLLQNHTRPGAALNWGSHWRYHLLERGPMILLSFGFGGLVCLLTNRPAARRGLRIAFLVVALYIFLSAMFAHSINDLRRPFVDTQYLGHQAREIFTHALVTMPLCWGAVLMLRRGAVAMPNLPVRIGLFKWPFWVIAVSLALMSYVLFASIAFDAAAQGQSDDIVTLVAPHFFEHGFTYIVSPLAAILTWAICRER